jgi:protein-tyrosine-phosphatase/DNA-binding HxlR family transcriptional regulator
MTIERSIARRAAIHAALADPYRLEIVDALAISDRSPTELSRSLAIGSNLLAHHLGVLEEAGLIERHQSDGDARRRYARLIPGAVSLIAEPAEVLVARHVLFVCSANSARSQLAAAAWNSRHEVPATSAGTRPAPHVRPEAVKAAARAGLDLRGARPRSLDDVTESPDLVVTVCDIAHEELPHLADGVRSLHWSVPDPALGGSPSAFDRALDRICGRIDSVVTRVSAHPSARRSGGAS